MNHAAENRHEILVTDEQRELERCKQEIARLKQLIVQLSELVVRKVVEDADG
ncbi:MULTISPECIES: hypothetical protein [unclassified Bradyrhizobium]